MTPHVSSCRHGRPATEALARVVAEAKADDPFAKVTVLVPSNLAGLSARRLLGSGELGGSGIVNVDFVTPFRLAELLAPVRTPGRNPLTNPILAAAVRRVLRETPGRFAKVAQHEATEAALVDLYEELSHALVETRRRIAGEHAHGRALVETFDRIAAVLDDYEGEDDLVEMAATHAESRADVVDVVGTLVWWLPEPVSPSVRALVRTLAAAVPTSVVVALTGAPESDALVRDTLAGTGIELVADPFERVTADQIISESDALVRGTLAGTGIELVADPFERVTADQIISVSDADEEVRAVVREVVGLVEAGVPLARIGIFHPRPDPYARVLHEQLTAAGIAHSGPSRRRLADLIAGRVVLAVLESGGDEFSRAAVMRLCATGPIRDDEGYVPQGRWERSSRFLGVVGGVDDWREKIGRHVARIEARIAAGAPDDADGDWVERRLGDIADAHRLLAFVEHLADQRRVIADAGSWADKAAAATEVVRRLLGPDSARLHWPEAERDAADLVDAALARLAVLDAVEPDPSDESFRRAVRAELDATVGRIGTYGRGLVFGPLSAAVGQDLDAVFVLGMAEGTCPAPRAEDPLLGDRLRSLAVDAELRTRADDLAAQYRAFSAGLAAAPAGSADHPRRFLTFPRGDLRSNRNRIPSRWLLETAERLVGHRVPSSEFGALGGPGVRVVASFADGLTGSRPATDLADHEAAAVQRFVLAGGDAAAHPVVSGVVRRGLEAAASRDAPRFTEWDGDVEGAEIELPGTTRPASPTRLQTWAECPFKYFLQHVLGLDERDDPATIAEIGALDRGSLLHRILEDFVGWAIAAERPGGPPRPSEAWSEDDRAWLHELAEVRMAESEALGRTGRPLAWEIEKGHLHRELDAWLTADDDVRAAAISTPARVEMAFGMNGEEPLEIATGSGRTLRFHGYIDRVDLGADGMVHVYDYKSSKYDKYKGLDDDPVEQGRTLQLGVYAEAVRARYGADREVDAAFWLAAAKGRNTLSGYRWTDERRTRMLEVTEAIVEGIEAGAFPATPGEYNFFWGRNERCTFCAFDSVCPADRADHQVATFEDPRAARFVARLALPADPPNDPADPGDPDPDPGGTTEPGRP